MKKYISSFLVIVLILSCCKKDDCETKLNDVDLSGIYNANFTEDNSEESTSETWLRTPVMEIAKINDTLYHLCVYGENSCVEGTTSEFILSCKMNIEGEFYYQRANALDWQMGIITGNYNPENNSVSGLFSAEKLVIVPPNEGDDYLKPIQGTFVLTKN